MVKKINVPFNDLLHTHVITIGFHMCHENNYIFVCSVLQVVQKNDTKIVASNMKKVFTEFKVLVFLLWVVFIGFFMSFLWNFIFW